MNLAKQFTFALASTLTQVAKEAQTAVLNEIREDFSIRNNWLQPSNAMGIKVLPATKDDLSSAVVTRADWLTKFETGEDKLPTGNSLAVPTDRIKRSKRDIIQKGQRPKNLKGAFLLTSRAGKKLIVQRRGRGRANELVVLYRLIQRAKIDKLSTVLEPTQATLEKRFPAIFENKLRQALATAR